MKNLSFTFVYVAAVILSSCSTETTYTVEMVDGVRTVHNLKPVYEGDSKISLEFVRQIGELDGEDENLQFFNPTYIDIDSDGNMYILDTGNFRVQKVDAEGNFIASIGKQGQGPGEFAHPAALHITEDNLLVVADMSNLNLVYFTPDGNVEFSKPFIKSRESMHFMRNGNIVVMNMIPPGPIDENNSQLASIYDTDGNLIQKMGSWELTDNMLRNWLGNAINIATDVDDIIYVSFPYRNRIMRFGSSGVVDLMFNKSRSYKETEEPVSKRMEGGGVHVEANIMYSSILIDKESRIWTLTTNQPFSNSPDGPSQDGVYSMDIYDSDGVLLQSFPWQYGLKRKPVHFHNDLMYFIDTDEMSIMEYKIVEH